VAPGRDWLDSLRTIVGNRMSYRREEQMQLVPPQYVIRLRGEDDSMKVMTAVGGSFLYVWPSSGVIAGWIDRDRAKLAALIETALHPKKPRTKPKSR
jgi:ribosomal protein L35AE/L33A